MRGFCTIATGSYEYSQLAHNLLLSYRRFSTQPLPFAVFTDHPNELLEDFDLVIELPKAQSGFLDKLQIFAQCPYEETIFIDADSLAYGDLCKYFDFFKDADDVSCLGEVFPADSERGWFRKCDTLQYSNQINYTIWLHGGIYYVKKTPAVVDFYNTCKKIEQYYKQIFTRFRYLTEPADEPIVALAMAVHKFKPIPAIPEILAFYRDSQIKKIDIVSGTLSYWVHSGYTDNGLLVHWATSNTKKPLYQLEVRKLKWATSNTNAKALMTLGMKLYWKIRYFFIKLQEAIR